MNTILQCLAAVFILGTYGVACADDPKSVSPCEAPWLITEVNRDDTLRLQESWRGRMCLIPESLGLEGVGDSGNMATWAWDRCKDGSYDFGSYWETSTTIFGKAGERLHLAPGVGGHLGERKKYLLVSIRLRQPARYPRTLRPGEDKFGGAFLSRGQEEKCGRFLGMYQMTSQWKTLIFQGEWDGVNDLWLCDGVGHRESLVSYVIPCPYRALGLSPAQVAGVERLAGEYRGQLAPLQQRYAMVDAERQKRVELEMRKRQDEFYKQVEQQLTDEQRAVLARIPAAWRLRRLAAIALPSGPVSP